VATVADALQTQLRNIESTYGRSIDEWAELIRASGARRHGEIVAMLKGERHDPRLGEPRGARRD
jgi:Domain of unknown function (DUF4287)